VVWQGRRGDPSPYADREMLKPSRVFSDFQRLFELLCRTILNIG